MTERRADTSNTRDDLDAALEEARSRYVERRRRSAAAFAQAAQHLPGGNTRSIAAG